MMKSKKIPIYKMNSIKTVNQLHLNQKSLGKVSFQKDQLSKHSQRRRSIAFRMRSKTTTKMTDLNLSMEVSKLIN